MSLWAIAKVLIAAVIISFASWLADKKPVLAGFIISLPLATILGLLFNYSQFGDAEKSVQFARSVFLSVPLSLLFFVPFLFADRLKLGFWGLYVMGFAFIGLGYVLHKNLFHRFF